MLEKGTKAPDFILNDKKGTKHSLSQYLGKKVIIYFYPKDDTPGCTKQACGFRDNYEKFINLGYVVIGISLDSTESHENFVKKYSLPFILLSDPELEVIKLYGVWQEKTNFGVTKFGVVRSTFIINEEGTIEKVYKRAKAASNAEDILKYLGV